MIRSWGLQGFTGTAQPLFGDLLTAPLSKLKQPNGFYFVSVANAARYQIGDRIVIGFGGTIPNNCLMVNAVNTTTNVLSCRSEGDAPVVNWPTGTQIVLSLACAVLTVQVQTGTAWLGVDDTVTNAGAGSAFAEILAGGSFKFGDAGWNTIRTTEAWIAGTQGDTYGVAAIII
jgi:hypothetical protein